MAKEKPVTDQNCEAVECWWPDVEAIDHRCDLLAGHEGPHHDPDLGEWESTEDG